MASASNKSEAWSEGGQSVTDPMENTVLVTGIPYITDDPEELKDKLTIHFSKSQNGGGEVERVVTPVGGNLENALIIFESINEVSTSRLFSNKHYLEDQIIQVQCLPPVFSKIDGQVDNFYSDIIPKKKSEELVVELAKRFGSGAGNWSKQRLTYVCGSLEFLRDVEREIEKSIGLRSMRLDTDETAVSKRSLKIDNIPFVTDDKDQLRDEILVYFKDKNKIELETLICPIKGSIRSAVAVFKCQQDLDRFLRGGDYTLLDQPLDAEKLPQVFKEVCATVDKFYLKSIPKATMKQVAASTSQSFGSKFTENGSSVSGKLHEVGEYLNFITQAFGVPSPVSSRLSPNKVDQPVKDQFSHPNGAANYTSEFYSEEQRDPMKKDTTSDDAPVKDMDDFNEDASAKVDKIQQEPEPPARFEECFITVDQMIYQFMETNYKKNLEKLKTRHSVKIKWSHHSTYDKLLVEVKPSRGGKGASNELNVQRAQEEFTQLYGKVFSSTKKEVIPFTNMKEVNDQDLTKIQTGLKKKYPNMVLFWNDSECIVCDDEATAEIAADELRESLSSFESMTIDRIGLQYLLAVHADHVDGIEKKYKVSVTEEDSDDANQKTVFIKPIKSKKRKCTIEEVGKAKEEFISLYQKVYYSIKRTPLKCVGASKEILSEARKATTQKHKKVCFVKGTTSDEVIVCAEENIADSVIRDFRTLAGIAPKKRLKKNVLGEADETKQRSPPTSDPDITQAATQMSYTSRQESKSILPTTFVTSEGLTLKVVTGDITKQTVNIIVNTTNPKLDFFRGISKAISTAAGPKLQKECKDILRGRFLGEGECLHSNAFNLRCRHVIHTVGPKYEGDNETFGRILTKTFSNVLAMNEDVLCCKSIAVPLISSGNLGGPKQYCAEIIVRALLDFSRNRSNLHLKEVCLVNNDEETTRTLQQVCVDNIPSHHFSASSDTTQKTPAHFTTSKGIDIVIENGDITQARADVIVNAANKRLKHGGGVAGALLKAAGKKLQHECDRLMKDRPPLSIGDCVVTDGYQLNRRILHTVGPIYRECSSDHEFYQYLKDTFVAAMKFANLPVEAKSIAIPLVSSGIYGGPKDICATALLNAVEEFNSERYHVIKTIVLINLDTEATQALYRVFAERYSRSPTSSTSPSSSTLSTVTTNKGEVGLKHTTARGLKIYVKKGDITREDVDAAVNPTDEYLRHQQGVAKAISTMAGWKLGQRCREIMKGRGPLRAGEVVETEGFDLRSKYIFHTCTPLYFNMVKNKSEQTQTDYHRNLSHTFEACLIVASRKQDVKSLAMPLIGSGHSGAPKDLCADALVSAIHRFHGNASPLSLESIVVVSTDVEVVDVTTKAVDNCFTKIRPDVGDLDVGHLLQHSVDEGKSSTVKLSNTDSAFSSHPPAAQNMNQYRGDAPKHGAIPKYPIPSKTVREKSQEADSTRDTTQAEQPGYLSSLMKPFMNMIGYDTKPTENEQPSDKVQQSSETEVETASGSNKRKSSLNDKTNPKKGQPPMCEKCTSEADLKRLEGCRHIYCSKCIATYVIPSVRCTTCQALYCVAYEKELQGTMTYYIRTNLTLPGERGNGAIEIIYEFPDGKLTGKVPYSGRKYRGNRFQAYLPNTAEGGEIAWLMKKAFEQGLTFDVKLKPSSSLEVTWSNQIPHKRQIKGGIGNYGYPDPKYLSRVRGVLKKYNITSRLTSKVDVRKAMSETTV